MAVVGSGPAGLAAADQLNRAGHAVTVFERADRIGGLLMYGIPNMKLDKREVVQRRVDLMTAEGVKFVVNMRGRQGPSQLQKLLTDFDAVVLCGGATQAERLLPRNRGAATCKASTSRWSSCTPTQKACSTAAWPTAITSRQRARTWSSSAAATRAPTASARRCGTAARACCNWRSCRCRRTTRAANNPWPQWPKIYKLDYGQEEAKALFGEDPRQYAIQTTKFVGDAGGHVEEIHTVRVEWIKTNGRMPYSPIPGTEQVFPAQLVLLALGFSGPESQLLDQLGVEKDPRTNAKAEHGKFATNVTGVFAAGDMRRGQSLVVWAINEGRGAARECDRYLMGTTQLP